jgi:hypothetical protein
MYTVVGRTRAVAVKRPGEYSLKSHVVTMWKIAFVARPH